MQEEGWEWKYIRVARGRCRCVFEENVLSVLVFSSQSYFKHRELSGRVWCLLTHQHNTPATGRDEKRGMWGENRERRWQRKISLLGYTSHVFPALFPHEFFFFSSLFITSSHSTCHKCLWLKLTLHSGSKGPKFQCSRQERERVRKKNRLKNERGKRKGTFFPLLVADLGCMASSDPDTLSPSHCPPAKDCKL